MPVTRSQTRSQTPTTRPSLQQPAAPVKTLSKAQIARKNREQEQNAERIRALEENARIFEEGRQREMEIHKDHPLMVFLKRLHSNPLTKKCAEIVQYRLCEMDPSYLHERWTYDNTNAEERYAIKMSVRAVKMVCPNAKFVSNTVHYNGETECERDITWKEGEMDEIVGNDFLFPYW